MKGVLDFKRRTLLYVLKDQLVIEDHKEYDLVKIAEFKIEGHSIEKRGLTHGKKIRP